MKLSDLIILIIVLIIICYTFKKEHFTSIDYRKQHKKFGDPLSTTYQYRTIEDQFPEVIAYDNDPETMQMGLDKCYAECEPKGGKCVEFGITGNAWCFPKTEEKEKNYKPDLDDQNNTRYSYANM